MTRCVCEMNQEQLCVFALLNPQRQESNTRTLGYSPHSPGTFSSRVVDFSFREEGVPEKKKDASTVHTGIKARKPFETKDVLSTVALKGQIAPMTLCCTWHSVVVLKRYFYPIEGRQETGLADNHFCVRCLQPNSNHDISDPVFSPRSTCMVVPVVGFLTQKGSK